MISLSEFHFLRPWILLLIIPALGLGIAILRRQDPTRAWRKIIAPDLLKHLLVGQEQQRMLRPIHVLAGCWLLGIIAAAGPTWKREPSPFADDSAAVIIIMKATSSMQESDVQPTRMQRAQLKVDQLLELRVKSKTALIAYAGSSHRVMPLTTDRNVITEFANNISPEIMPKEGDDLIQALLLGQKELERTDSSGSIVVLADEVSEDLVGQESLASIKTPIQFLELNSLPNESLRALAKKLNSRVVTWTSDSKDVETINSHLDTEIVRVMADDESTRWRESGYWLTFVILVLGLLWLRPGWVVRYW